ncbi:unnamed protein product, partial [Chrysoparadoxa australica]
MRSPVWAFAGLASTCKAWVSTPALLSRRTAASAPSAFLRCDDARGSGGIR